MASGWAKDDATSDQIRDSLNDEIRRARSALPQGPGSEYCDECGEKIPEARRKALPGARLCVACQEEADKSAQRTNPYNRKGSKGSQLR
ncbi:MAG: DksA/TraR family C4-type zinc finger protein [Desulfovibrio sp.]|nr:DksA/TraR family C4-type zinc finger protein [Desulfovibrio sp.]